MLSDSQLVDREHLEHKLINASEITLLMHLRHGAFSKHIVTLWF